MQNADAQTNLGEAARGYVYQDVATAYFLAVALFEDGDAVVVDSKLHEADIFDDLTVVTAQRKVRRQFKSSADAAKEFSDKVLKTTTNDLRIDDILDCWNKAGTNPADEYRICSTWQSPTDDGLKKLLLPANCDGSFIGWATDCYKLDADRLWPESGSFLWQLRERNAGIRMFTRDQLCALCDRLIIELNCPQLSLNWESPGDLERLLIEYLSERIGVGRYPNQHRKPTDVAARLVLRASQARVKQETIDPKSLLHDLELRSDYGRLPQKFPIAEDEFVQRPEFVSLKNSLDDGAARIAVSGPPGSGKSWLLTNAAEALAESGYVVLRHYCFTEPQDKLRAERVTVQALYANLTAAILEQLPELRKDSESKLGATRSDWQRLLQAIGLRKDIKAVVVVDGLDHITRVLSSEPGLAPEQTAIVQELATMPLPENVSLIVGSQPIMQLNDLGIEKRIEIAPWTRRDELELLKRLGLLQQLFKGSTISSARLLRELLERSEGNPLYLRYLAIQVKGLEIDADRFAAVQNIPTLGGDLTRYYSYLFNHKEPPALARLLSVVDFSLGQQDFSEIFPLFAPEIGQWLRQLKPVLSTVTAQGGCRIYHDSFRQYVLEECKSRNLNIGDVFPPLVGWLQKKGFFEDGRAYNHLLGLLHAVGKDAEALALLSETFVSRSLEWLHSEESIRANLSFGAELAADRADWIAMTRLSELHRVVHSAFQEHLANIDIYQQTFARVHGYQALVERLLIDGRPAFDVPLGLTLCSMCDDHGIVPPWCEYLENMSASDEDQSPLASFHGFCRTEPANQVLTTLLDFLLTAHPDSDYLRGLLNRLKRSFGVDALWWLAARLPAKNQQLAFELALALAKGYQPGTSDRTWLIEAAMDFSSNCQQARECLELGATRVPKTLSIDIDALVTRINLQDHRGSYDFACEWVDSIMVAARCSPEKLISARERIIPDGWYRAWMRYVIDLALAAEARHSQSDDAETRINAALAELSTFNDPDAGSISCLDLYPIRLPVLRTITQTFALTISDDALLHVIRSFRQMTSTLTRWVMSVPMGPFSLSDLLECLFKLSRTRPLSKEILQEAESLVAESTRQGAFYSVQAEMSMQQAVMHSRSCSRDAAKEHWARACQYLCGYGERKDATIFELIEGLPAGDKNTRIALIEELRPLVDRVDAFTDGKGTKHAAIAVFEQLECISAPDAGMLLLNTIIKRGFNDWRLQSCLQDLLLKSSAEIDPVIGFFVLHHIEHVNGLEETMQSLVLLERLAQVRPELVQNAFQRLIAWPSSLHFGREKEMYAELLKFAEKNAIVIPQHLRERSANVTDYSGGRRPSARGPIFQPNSTVTEAIRTLRECSAREYEKRPEETQLANAIFYRVLELLDIGNQSDAERLLSFFRDHYYLSDKGPILAGISDGLARYNHNDMAASLFTDAYMHSRGGGGWLSVGGDEHIPLLERGVSLSPTIALKQLFERFRYLLSQPGYLMGLTRYLVNLSAKFSGKDTSIECWREAYKVIKPRLDTSQRVPSFFEGKIQTTTDWSIDELFIGLLLAIPQTSTDAFKFIFESHSSQALRPVEHIYGRASEMTRIRILSILRQTDPLSRPAANALRSELEKTSAASWPLAKLSQQILACLAGASSRLRQDY